jgi:hypothetical protein
MKNRLNRKKKLAKSCLKTTKKTMCKCGRIPPQKKHFLEILANCFFSRERIYGLIEISAKSGKESTSTQFETQKTINFFLSFFFS